jgi:cyanophycinase-like exopeptidase
MKTSVAFRLLRVAAISAFYSALLIAPLSSAKAGGKLYQYFSVGNPATIPVISPTDRATTPSYVVMGGGPDVDVAFQWLIQRAGIKSGTGGRLVIIRATGTEAYNPYIYYSDANGSTASLPPADQDGWVGGAYLGLSSVETLVIPSVNAANDPTVNQIVARADVVFIAGGDQGDYIKYWKNTQLDWTLQTLMANKVPIGGTSAGLAVLGQFDFAALNGTVTSARALANPFNKYMSLDPTPQTLNATTRTSSAGGFITPSPLFNTILDAHVDERDRMGRLVTFVSRLIGPYNGAGCSGGILLPSSAQPLLPQPYGDLIARGIGVGVEAALLISGDGTITPIMAKLVTNPTTISNSAAYFVLPQNYPGQCAAGKALSGVTSVVNKVDKLNPNFNMSTWLGGYPPYTLTVTNGIITVNGNNNQMY